MNKSEIRNDASDLFFFGFILTGRPAKRAAHQGEAGHKRAG